MVYPDMNKQQIEIIKAAYFSGVHSSRARNKYIIKASDLGTGAISGGVLKLLSGGLGTAAGAVSALGVGLASLLFGFSIGAATAIKPIGESVGANLKAAPLIPLSETQIKNMLIRNRLLQDSTRVRKQKEKQLATIAEKLIKERFQIDE